MAQEQKMSICIFKGSNNGKGEYTNHNIKDNCGIFVSSTCRKNPILFNEGEKIRNKN